MGLVSEFKEFAVKGNVVDMAVGIIIGGAFGKIVSSFVADVIMPPVGLVLGGADFSKLSWVLRAAPDPKDAVVLKYGQFLQNVVDFLIVAAVIFTAIKIINRLKREEKKEEEAAAPAEPPEDILLLRDIRDALKK
jgi:large conductance mechanosensitive channel